jgi:hypothetical protein
MSGSPRPTRKEVASERMRQRLLKHIEDWHQGYTHKNPQELDFITDDGKLELWECTMVPPQGSKNEDGKIWLFWDAREIKSYESYKSAFVDFVMEQKSKRVEGRFKYFTSPLTVSAVLALCMLLLIAYLLWRAQNVPDQLWSVFTAVIAFYFGKESGTRTENTGGTD